MRACKRPSDPQPIFTQNGSIDQTAWIQAHAPFAVKIETICNPWPPYPISYWCSIVICDQALSPALLEIFENWVTTLTFLGHMMSSVTWPFDSPYPICYRCSTVTKCVSPAVFEIFDSKVPGQCKSSLRMRDITWPVPLCKFLVHILISHPHIAYSLWHFYWAQSDEE